MTQHRELVPITVYIPKDAKEEADRRATSDSIAVAALCRRILLGKEKPLSS